MFQKDRIKKILIGIGIAFVLVASFVTIKDEVFLLVIF